MMEYIAGWTRLMVACTVSSLTVSLNSLAQTGCDLKKDKDGIKVYTCDSTGLSIKKIASNFTVDLPVADVAEFVMDINNYPAWQYNTTETYLIKKISDAELLYYVKVTAPWPVGDRDMVIDQKVQQDPATKTVIITAVSKPDAIARNDRLVRVPMSSAKWTIVPVLSGVKIDYEVVLDPGGSLPPWMVNMVSAQAPYESFKKLKETIKRRETRDFRFIVN